MAVAACGSVFATGYIINNDTGYEVWTAGMSARWRPLFTVSHGSPTWQDDYGHDIALAGDSLLDGFLIGKRFRGQTGFHRAALAQMSR